MNVSIITSCTNGICVCVLPLERNDFRPLALRHRSLAFISTLLLLAKVLSFSVVALTPITAELSTITTARITALTNAERTKVGLPALTTNSQLTAAAAAKANDMLGQDYFAHISPSGVTPWFWMSKESYAYQVAGENLAIDFIEAEAVVAAWLASPGHKANLLHSSYTETGIAVATGEFQGGTSTVVVHMFGLPSGGAAPTATPIPAPAASTPTSKPVAAAAKAPPVQSVVPSPTVTPAPTASSAPLATIAPTPLPDNTPPLTPQLSYEVATPAQTIATVTITGELNSTIHILLNNQERVLVRITTDQTIAQPIDISGLPDGVITLRAYASDTAKNISATSNVVSLTKDTTAPELAQSGIYGLLSPQTDQPQIALYISSSETSSGTIKRADAVASIFTTTEPAFVDPLITTTIVLNDHANNASPAYKLQLLPTFQQEADTSFISPSSRFSRGARIFAAVTFIIILFLLSLAILIRFSQQRLALITHASLVLFLALIIFLW